MFRVRQLYYNMNITVRSTTIYWDDNLVYWILLGSTWILLLVITIGYYWDITWSMGYYNLDMGLVDLGWKMWLLLNYWPFKKPDYAAQKKIKM